MAGGLPIRRAGRCCSSTRGRAAARPHTPGSPSGRAKRGSRLPSSPRARTWTRWPGKPWRLVQTRSGWPVATGRCGRGRSGGCARDPVCVRSGRDAQPLRARRGGGPARRGRRSRRVHRRGGAPDRRGRGERPRIPQQRLAGGSTETRFAARPTATPPGRAWSAPRLEVSAPEPVHAGVDGEAVELSPPLQFAIRPAALQVRISSRHPGASPSARLRLPGHPPRCQGRRG